MTVNINVCIYYSYTNFFVSFMLFGILKIRLLKDRLKNCFNEGNTDSFKEIIEEHNNIINYVKILNNLFTNICFIEYLFVRLMLCVLLFMVIFVTESAQKIILCVFAISLLIQTFLFYYLGNELKSESLSLSDAMYDSLWYLKKSQLYFINNNEDHFRFYWATFIQ